MYNIFVGNLSFKASREDVMKLFASFGTVSHVMIMQKKKNKSRGFGFVAMPNEEEKNKAMTALGGKEFMGRELAISPFVPKAQKIKPKRIHREFPKPTEKPPYKKFDGPSRPRGKSEGASKPLSKTGGGFKMFYKKDKPSHKREQ